MCYLIFCLLLCFFFLIDVIYLFFKIIVIYIIKCRLFIFPIRIFISLFRTNNILINIKFSYLFYNLFIFSINLFLTTIIKKKNIKYVHIKLKSSIMGIFNLNKLIS